MILNAMVPEQEAVGFTGTEDYLLSRDRHLALKARQMRIGCSRKDILLSH